MTITNIEDVQFKRALKTAKRKEPVNYDATLNSEAKKLVDEMIDSVTAIALHQDPNAGPAMGHFEDRMTGKAPVSHQDVLAAFIAGMRTGSVAVARQWVKKSPETMWAYYALGGKSLDAADRWPKDAA